MNEIERVQASVSIADVVSRYRPLVKAGKNFKALCPFHDDHSPSLVVNIEQNFAWCFACQNGGNSFVVVQKIEGCSFPEAVKIVGDIGGVDTSFLSKMNPEKHKEHKEHSERIRDVLKETQGFFLKNFSQYAPAQKYITETRKLSHSTIKTFEIGYAPDSFSDLKNYLLQKGFSRKEMLEAGVVSQSKQKDEVIDKFRSRITFPIKDSLGKICGFGGRILGEGEPKYMNSPDTLLYDKSSNLFGFFEAKESIRKKNRAILVEGNLDVMSCHQFGIHNVVAISGVGFSDQQAKLLKRFSTRALLALDSDTAGIQAAERILPTLLSQNISTALLEIPYGKDPDEAVQYDATQFLLAIENANNAVATLLQKWITEIPLTSAENKRRLFNKLFPLLMCIPQKMEQSETLLESSHILKMDIVLLQDEFTKFQQTSHRRKKAPAQKKINTSQEISQKTYFWGVLLKFFPECTKVFEIIQPEFFEEEHEKQLYYFLQHAYNERSTVSMREKFSTLSDDFREEVMKSMLFADQSLGNLSAKQRQPYILNLIKSSMAEFYKNMGQKIKLEPSNENIQQFQHITKIMKIL